LESCEPGHRFSLTLGLDYFCGAESRTTYPLTGQTK